MPSYFAYTSEATSYLPSRDKRLGQAIAAVLYLWAIAGGGIPGFERDYAPLTVAQKKARARARAHARKTGGS